MKDYRKRYFIHSFAFIWFLFLFSVFMAALREVIQTKTIFITWDLPGLPIILPMLLVVTLLFSYFAGYCIAPMDAEPQQIEIAVPTEESMENTYDKIRTFLLNNKSRNMRKRIIVKEENGETVFATGDKYLDWLLNPVIVTKSGHTLIVYAPRIYIKEIKKITENP